MRLRDSYYIEILRKFWTAVRIANFGRSSLMKCHSGYSLLQGGRGAFTSQRKGRIYIPVLIKCHNEYVVVQIFLWFENF